MRRKQAIGLPADVTLYVSNTHPTADSADRFNDIRFTQYVTFYRGQQPVTSTVPGIWFPTPRSGMLPFPTDQPFGMLFFGWDTATEDESVVARFTWSAHDWSRETPLSVEGWSQCSASRIAHLLNASEDFMQKTRGRPKGVTDYTLADYQRAFRTCRDRCGGRPKLTDVAAELNQHQKTVRTNLKRWGQGDYRQFAETMLLESDIRN